MAPEALGQFLACAEIPREPAPPDEYDEDLTAAKRQFTVHWINIESGGFGKHGKLTGGSSASLSPPNPKDWVATIVAQ